MCDKNLRSFGTIAVLFMQALQISQQATPALEEEMAAAHQTYTAPVRRQQPNQAPPHPQVSCNLGVQKGQTACEVVL